MGTLNHNKCRRSTGREVTSFTVGSARSEERARERQREWERRKRKRIMSIKCIKVKKVFFITVRECWNEWENLGGLLLGGIKERLGGSLPMFVGGDTIIVSHVVPGDVTDQKISGWQNLKTTALEVQWFSL